MADLDMTWSGDLSITATGDLLLAQGTTLGTQRVLRRLMTNPSDYIWNPDYGAGLSQYIGRPLDAAGIQALILGQMQLEAAVAAVPEPTVDVQSDQAGRLYTQIRYADAATAKASALSINLPEAQ